MIAAANGDFNERLLFVCKYFINASPSLWSCLIEKLKWSKTVPSIFRNCPIEFLPDVTFVVVVIDEEDVDALLAAVTSESIDSKYEDTPSQKYGTVVLYFDVNSSI